MSFGKRTRGTKGHMYDSKSEKKVARHLDNLRREQVVKNYMPHLLVAGVEVDFFVRPGNQAGQEKSPIIVEYDGMGLSRRECLEGRIRRLSRLAKYGIETRWLTEPTLQATKDLILDYTPPHFLHVKAVCSDCGEESSKYLIDRNRLHEDKKELQKSAFCQNCK